MQNLSLYGTILMVLEETDYATTTWRIRRQTFWSIYIPGWGNKGRENIDVYSWLEGFWITTKAINKRVMSLDTSSLRRCEEDNSRSNENKDDEERCNGTNEKYTWESYPRLILIPQHGEDILKWDKLLYDHLVNPVSRAIIRDRLINLLSV